MTLYNVYRIDYTAPGNALPQSIDVADLTIEAAQTKCITANPTFVIVSSDLLSTVYF
jgi:hypothetical protein